MLFLRIWYVHIRAARRLREKISFDVDENPGNLFYFKTFISFAGRARGTPCHVFQNIPVEKKFNVYDMPVVYCLSFKFVHTLVYVQ